LPAAVLDRAPDSVEGARAAERDEMSTRFRNAQQGGPRLRLQFDSAPIPRLAHEAEAVGRVGHNSVDRVRLKLGQPITQVAYVERRIQSVMSSPRARNQLREWSWPGYGPAGAC